MRACVVLRGISYRYNHVTCGGRGNHTNVDYRKCIDSFWTYVMNPLYGIFGEQCVDVYASTYESEKQEDIMKAYKLKRAHFIPYSEGCESRHIIAGLNLVKSSLLAYDLVIVMRFDIEFKKPLIDWCIVDRIINERLFMYPWRETGALDPDRSRCWQDHNRVGNAFFVFHGDHIDSFIQSLFRDGYTHHNYRHLTQFIHPSRVAFFIEEGFLDSNSCSEPNPYYTIVRY